MRACGGFESEEVVLTLYEVSFEFGLESLDSYYTYVFCQSSIAAGRCSRKPADTVLHMIKTLSRLGRRFQMVNTIMFWTLLGSAMFKRHSQRCVATTNHLRVKSESRMLGLLNTTQS